MSWICWENNEPCILGFPSWSRPFYNDSPNKYSIHLISCFGWWSFYSSSKEIWYFLLTAHCCDVPGGFWWQVSKCQHPPAKAMCLFPALDENEVPQSDHPIIDSERNSPSFWTNQRFRYKRSLQWPLFTNRWRVTWT